MDPTTAKPTDTALRGALTRCGVNVPAGTSRGQLLTELNRVAVPGTHPPHSDAWHAACAAQQLIYAELGLDWYTAPYVDQDSLRFS